MLSFELNVAAHEKAMNIRTAALFLLWGLVANVPLPAEAEERPNIVFVLIDDLGYGDFSCTGNAEVSTPNIDRLAAQGTRFTQFHSNSPICSPSRVAFTTGQYPQRWGIHSYLNSRAVNARRQMADFLDPQAPAIARAFQAAGYATAHFGKWHMGGGRNVGDAPLPQEYGFDESLVSFEGLGDRILPPGPLSDQSEKLGRGNIRRVEKHEQTSIYVDRAIDFITRKQAAPFYLHLWLNDVHDPFVPAAGEEQKFAGKGRSSEDRKFYAVLVEMDRQLGRLFDEIDRLKLAGSTLILVTGDNGPTAWPRYYNEGIEPPGSTAGDRGRKWSLYEGGIRLPLIARWRGKVAAGRVDRSSLIVATDFFPTLTSLANVKRPEVVFDGEDAVAALLGKSFRRTRPVVWDYRQDIKPGKQSDISPMLAVREGDWKLLMNPDGTQRELYDLADDPQETNNLAGDSRRSAMQARLQGVLDDWLSQRGNMDQKRPPPLSQPK